MGGFRILAARQKSNTCCEKNIQRKHTQTANYTQSGGFKRTNTLVAADGHNFFEVGMSSGGVPKVALQPYRQRKSDPKKVLHLETRVRRCRRNWQEAGCCKWPFC